MKHWENIQNHAMLGTARSSKDIQGLPETVAAEIRWTTTDSEEDFLKLASVAWQYRQAGLQPLTITETSTAAEPEVKPYATISATDDLRSLIEEEQYTLVKIWLEYCLASSQVVRPEVLPELLEVATRRKELRSLVADSIGNRGQWLQKLNPAWGFSKKTEDETTVWQTGTPDERRELLASIQQADPGRVVEVLQSTWSTESASDKAAFLTILAEHPSPQYLSWLEELQEKGQKVTTAITYLLRNIPGSKIVTQYQDILRQAISPRTGKALLGMISKNVLEVNEAVTIPGEVFKTGIEKLSSDKNISDQQYIFIQLITSVPPAFWQKHLQQEDIKAIVTLVQKEEHTAIYLPAIAIAAVKFKDLAWVRALLDHGDTILLHSAIMPLIETLPEKERLTYAARFLRERPQEVIDVILRQQTECDAALAKAVVTYTASEVYTYNRTFYRQAIYVLPISLLAQLESFAPSEEAKKPYWRTQADELYRLLSWKEQLLKAFPVKPVYING